MANPLAAAPASSGTWPSGVHWLIPAVKTSVARSICPARSRAITSSCVNGPACAPFTTRYHCPAATLPLLDSTRA